MNRNEPVAQVVAETSTSTTAAERLAGAVFVAVADALARDETVSIAGFGKLAVRSRAAAAIPAPQSPSTSPPHAASRAAMLAAGRRWGQS